MTYVIQVGKLFLKNPLEDLCFTPDLDKAATFQKGADIAKATTVAARIGGELVPVRDVSQNIELQVSFHVPSISEVGIDAWLKAFMPYILNCVGPELQMVAQFQTWSTPRTHYVNVTSYVGLPCELYVGAYAGDGETDNHSFAFHFTLRVKGSPTKSQLDAWYKLPYGILTAEGNRILTPCIKVTKHNAYEFASVTPKGYLKVKDTEERRALVAQRFEGFSQTPTGSGVKSMNLGGRV